jgi:hypothetical protein
MSISRLTGNGSLMHGGASSGMGPNIKALEELSSRLISQYTPNLYSSISAASAQNLLKKLLAFF